MTAQKIVEIIRRRRDDFWDRQSFGSPTDQDGGAAAQCLRNIADEYDSLLQEIEELGSD